MFVINRYALQSIDLLNFIDEIILQFFLAEHPKDVMGISRTVHESFPGNHFITFVHVDVFSEWDEILTLITGTTFDKYLPHTLNESAKPDLSRDLRNGGLFAWF